MTRAAWRKTLTLCQLPEPAPAGPRLLSHQPTDLGVAKSGPGFSNCSFLNVWPFPFRVKVKARVRTYPHGRRRLLPPPYRLGRSIEWCGLFKPFRSEVGPCPSRVKVKVLVRTRAHGCGVFVPPPPYRLGRQIDWRGLLKLRISDVGPCRFDVWPCPFRDLVRTGAHWSRTAVPPQVLRGGHANRAKS